MIGVSPPEKFCMLTPGALAHPLRLPLVTPLCKLILWPNVTNLEEQWIGFFGKTIEWVACRFRAYGKGILPSLSNDCLFSVSICILNQLKILLCLKFLNDKRIIFKTHVRWMLFILNFSLASNFQNHANMFSWPNFQNFLFSVTSEFLSLGRQLAVGHRWPKHITGRHDTPSFDILMSVSTGESSRNYSRGVSVVPRIEPCGEQI